MVYGPLRHTVKSVKELNQSNSRIYDLFVNSKKDAELAEACRRLRALKR